MTSSIRQAWKSTLRAFVIGEWSYPSARLCTWSDDKCRVSYALVWNDYLNPSDSTLNGYFAMKSKRYLDCMKTLPLMTYFTVPDLPANCPSLTVTRSPTLMLLPFASGAVNLRLVGNFRLMSGCLQTLILGLSAVPYMNSPSVSFDEGNIPWKNVPTTPVQSF